MSTHLAHKLPWESLGEIIRERHAQNISSSYRRRPEVSLKHIKAVYHFARCLGDAIREFAASDRSMEEEKRRFDPSTWGLQETTRWSDIGYYDSLIVGYVELNLILMDPTVFAPIVQKYEQWGIRTMRALCGYNGEHPQWLGEQLRPAFDGENMKAITAEVLQVLRETCALLFRCIHSISEPNLALGPDFVADTIGLGLGFNGDISTWRIHHPDVQL